MKSHQLESQQRERTLQRTEEERKQGTPSQSGIPDAREEDSERTDGQWGQYRWQVREGLKVSTGSGNMEVTGDCCQSSLRGVRVEGSHHPGMSKSSGVRKQRRLS